MEPLLAAVENLVGVIMFIVMVVGWLSKLISGAQEQKRPQVPRNRPRPPAPPMRQPGEEPVPANSPIDRLQQEIETFRRQSSVAQERLERRREAAERRAQEQARREPKPRGNSGSRGGKSSGSGGQSNSRKSKPLAKPMPSSQESESSQPRRPMGDDIANRTFVSSNLGSAVRDSVRDHIANQHLAKEVAQDMRPEVALSVQQHLGTFQPSSSQQTFVDNTNSATALSLQLVAMLKDRQTVAQAMLVNTILSRPLGLKQRR